MRLLSLGPAVSCSQRQICPCADLRCGAARAVNISGKLLHVVRNLLSWERRCELKCDMMTAVRVGYQTLSTSVLHRLQKSNKMNKLVNSLNMTMRHRLSASRLHLCTELLQRPSSLDLICPGNLTRNSQFALSHTSVMDRLSRALLKGPSAAMAAGRRVIKDDRRQQYKAAPVLFSNDEKVL